MVFHSHSTSSTAISGCMVRSFLGTNLVGEGDGPFLVKNFPGKFGIMYPVVYLNLRDIHTDPHKSYYI